MNGDNRQLPDATNASSQSKPRYDILDGLRGVAAVYVLVYHLFEGCGISLGHGHLGVDFFFALSGFVIGYAYDGRWGVMSTMDFFKRRVIRLHPMVLVAMVLGLCLFYFGESAFFPRIAATPWWKALALFFYCSLLLPMPNAWDIRGWQDTNSFNGSVWSLQWEYLVNILYAFVLRRLSTVALGVLTAVTAFGTIDLALNLDVFNVFSANRAMGSFSVNGGWSLTAAELYIGAVRLLYPFLAGYLLSRVKWLIRIPGGFWTCSAIILAFMSVPKMTGFANGIYEVGVILVLIPLLVSMGAGSPLKGAKTSAFCRFLGEISYPLYIIHLPIAYLQMAWVSNHPNAARGTVVLLSCGVFLVSIAAAYACLRLYDAPVRRWLTNLGRKGKREGA